MAGYDFTAIEKKWQQHWADHETFRQPNPGEESFRDAPKFYVLDMFPYPSGAGLHVGHPEGYTASDIVARHKRMTGCNVLHPMGYDAFGLPAEQYAVEHGVHPRQTTADNVDNIERQIKMFGFSYDWSRRLATTDTAYYRWTQWVFLRMFNSWYDPAAGAARPIAELVDRLEDGELVVDLGGNVVPAPAGGDMEVIAGLAGGVVKFTEMAPDQRRRLIDEYRLAYLAEVPVNWCPQLGTVLANEEVTNEGRSDRGDFPVYRRPMTQWMLRITAYAERLLEDLALVDWPEPIKIMQRNWIGKSTGADVDFRVAGSTGVSPVSHLFRSAAEVAEEARPALTAKTFQGIDPYPKGEPSHQNLMGYIRNLPHLEVAGATYFVTFNTVDGATLDQSDRDSVMASCVHWHGDRSCVYAVAVLDNHVHMIVRPFEGHPLSEILHSIKSFTSHQINRSRGRSGPFWTEESFDHIVRDEKWLTRFIYYICDNPVKRGLCSRFDEYPWLWVNAEEVATLEAAEPFGHFAHGRDARATTAAHGRDARATTAAHGRDARATTAAHGRDARATTADDVIRVYTTRPDTLFGATYMVLAPEHPLTQRITTDEHREAVQAYVAAAARKSELERTTETKEKSGVFTGAYAVNPVNRERIPIWVADYVMMGYGTGAIMAVPAHDTRDLEFAEQFDLPVVQVVEPGEGVDWRGYVGEGTAVNSGKYDGLPTAEFIEKITADLAADGLGRFAVNYKLRDWLFSRQRYWGEPFPIVHCAQCGPVALGEHELPLELPDMEDFTPAASDDPAAPPAPPLAKAERWVSTTCPLCDAPARRETNTMPQWAGSCWYYLRFLDPHNDRTFCDPAVEKYWMGERGIDLYVGGAEHAVLHLLYARFWHKLLYDLGCVSTPEPFGKLFNQGMIRSFAYRDGRGVYVGYDDVDTSGDQPRHKASGEALTETVEKMSKSLKNVINPDDVIAEYGADTFRLYEMFMGPLEASKPWNTRDVPGVHRFCHRVWRMICGDDDRPALLGSTGVSPVKPKDTGETPVPPDKQVERGLHKLIKKVGEDIEAMKFNTAIAAMMEFVNTAYKVGIVHKDQAERFVLVLSPFAPHLGEELWQRLGHDQSLAHEPWPEYDDGLIAAETVELAVQVNGKVRGRISVPAEAAEDDVVAAALAEPKVAAASKGKTVVKTIVVPGRLVNIVVR